MTLATYMNYLFAATLTVMFLIVIGLSIYALYMFFRAVKNEQRLQKEDNLKKEISELKSELHRVKQCGQINFSTMIRALDEENIVAAKIIAMRGFSEMKK